MSPKEFRAWDKVNKKWVSPDQLQNPRVMGVDLTKAGFKFKIASSDFIFVQYIGVKDDKKKKIFEGDIIRQKYMGHPTKSFYPKREKVELELFVVVTFIKEDAGFYLCDKSGRVTHSFPLDYSGKFEVVGNKFEDKGLLK